MSVANPGTSESRDSLDGPSRWVPISLATFVLAVFAFLAVRAIPQFLEMTDGDVRRFQRNIGELKAGKTKTLHLIAKRHTDSLLEQIRGMPEIEDIYIEDADIKVVGMRHLGTLPNLKTLMAYNAVGDAGMLELRNCKKLEDLTIYDGSITDEAIAELHRYLPNVRVGTKHDKQ